MKSVPCLLAIVKKKKFKFAGKTDKKFINDSSIFLKLKLRKIKTKFSFVNGDTNHLFNIIIKQTYVCILFLFLLVSHRTSV